MKAKLPPWDQFIYNQKSFEVLSGMIDQILDIQNRLNGWGENPITIPDLPKVAFPNHEIELEIDQVLEGIYESLLTQYHRLQSENINLIKKIKQNGKAKITQQNRPY